MRKRFLRPPGLPMHSATLGAMLWALVSFSAPGAYTEAALLAALLWLLLVATWLIRLIAVLFLARMKSMRHRGWLVLPAFGLITFGILCLGLPMRLRFFVSRPALTRLANQAIASGPKSLSSWGSGTVQRAGAYDVIVSQVTPAGEVDFIVTGTFFMRSCSGFTYKATGSPDDPEGSFEPLGGPWYVWHTSW